MKEQPTKYEVKLTVNGNKITTVLMGQHYLKKHSTYMTDHLILELVKTLNGHYFEVDSTTGRCPARINQENLSNHMVI